MFFAGRRLAVENFGDLTKDRSTVHTAVTGIEIRENMISW
jgi:hypothetical protein